MYYTFDWDRIPLAAGLWEEWSPSANNDQQTATAYVTSSNVSSILDNLVSYCRDHHDLLMTAQYGRLPATQIDKAQQHVSKLVNAVSALVFRTRWQHAEQGDVAEAVRSLRVAFLLSRLYTQCHACESSYNRAFVESFAQYELGCLAREHALDSALVREMLAELGEVHPLSMTRVIREYQQQDREVDMLLDRYYTCDENGDGWVVLSTDWPSSPYMPLAPQPGHNRFWNVFSPLFHGRATMRAKLTASLAGLDGFDDLDYGGMLRILTESEEARSFGSVLDGPMLTITKGVDREAFASLLAYTAQQRALTVILALSAYRFDHGRYPESLDALVPTYLTEVPLELRTHQPFIYELIGTENYNLKIEPDATHFFTELYWPGRCYDRDSYVPCRSEPPFSFPPDIP